ncbi:hypothetical protein DICVIV_05978 [Dictyocaulus viviparus]|uniref:Uncharacterized protein n=1 Tax=Dictyocaulus viviparus TaxID=29172 RepID=A0A0D8XZY6_DICVI|nr:hypothetical protein DICVIV_05978 [Dictyocaulus viviparus]
MFSSSSLRTVWTISGATHQNGDVSRVMGSALCGPRQKKVRHGFLCITSIFIDNAPNILFQLANQVSASWIGNELENPFESKFTKKERILLRETYQSLPQH